MTHSFKSFLAFLAFALFLQIGLFAHTEGFPQLEDLSQTEQELTRSLANFLNQYIDLNISSFNSLSDLFMSRELHKQQFEAYQPSVSSEDDAASQLNTIFQEESENFLAGDSEGLTNKCRSLFEEFAIFALKSRNTHQPVNLQSNKLISALRNQMENFVRIYQSMLRQPSESKVIFDKVVATLKVSASFKSQVADYIGFKQNPVKILHESSIDLINLVNENPAQTNPHLDQIADRIYEYAKAIVLISKKRKTPYQKWIGGLVSKLSAMAKKARLSHSNSPAFKWNVTLMRRLLQLLNGEGNQTQSINLIEAYFESPTVTRTRSNLLHPIVLKAYQNRLSIGGFTDEDFNILPRALNIVDSFNYLLRQEIPVLDQHFLNSVIDKFDRLALATAGKENSEDFLVKVINNLDIPFANNQDFYHQLYQSIQEFRAHQFDSFSQKKEYQDFDEFINLKFSTDLKEPMTKFYLPLKISFAKSFLNEQEHLMSIKYLDNKLIENTRKFLKQNNLKTIDRILLGAFHQKEGKIRKHDLLAKNYIGDISGRQIPTRNIAELAKIKLNVIDDQMNTDVMNDGDESLPEGEKISADKILSENNALNVKDRHMNPKIMIDSDLSENDSHDIKTINHEITVNLEDNEEPTIIAPMIDLSIDNIRKTSKKKSKKSKAKIIDNQHTPLESSELKKSILGSSLIDRAENPVFEADLPSVLDDEADLEPEILPNTDHKLIAKRNLENLIDVLSGTLSPQQEDALRQSENILELLSANRVDFASDGKDVEVVYVQITEENSKCFLNFNKRMNK